MVRKLLDDGLKERAASLRRKEAIINVVREDSPYGDVPNIPVDSSDEDDDDTDEHGMSALERKQLRHAMAESRYRGFVEDETPRSIGRGAGYGSPSKESTSGAKRGISQNFGVKSGIEMPPTGFDPHMFPSRKKSVKGMLSKEGMKKVGKAVSKFFIFNALPFNAADSGPYMQSMIDTIAEVRPGVKGPSGYQIGNIYLNEEIEELEKYISTLKVKWPIFGCTIMCDDWSSRTRHPIINFMIYCDRNMIYHSSVDCTNKEKNENFIFGLMDQVVEEIGE
ncbi:hypothetical protein Salat_1405700 [Sesamum alatum]|uniref:DUF659 domain-containing protein n=1 Tax=Sesamum alatum TaxID=300844 RepID=A0AAE1Y9V3_9LAMI|nr:hypothetical protein Salat_1405700 [Sesamum alatum]